MYTDTTLRRTLPVVRGFLVIRSEIVAFIHLPQIDHSHLKVGDHFVM
jgi:hypothetical protein